MKKEIDNQKITESLALQFPELKDSRLLVFFDTALRAANKKDYENFLYYLIQVGDLAVIGQGILEEGAVL